MQKCELRVDSFRSSDISWSTHHYESPAGRGGGRLTGGGQLDEIRAANTSSGRRLLLLQFAAAALAVAAGLLGPPASEVALALLLGVLVLSGWLIVRNPGGRGAAIKSAGMRIDELERSLGILREGEARYRRILDVSGVIGWQGRPGSLDMEYVVGRPDALLGYSADEWCSPDFWLNHLHPEDRETAKELCTYYTSRGEDHQFDYRMVAADGRIVWLRDHVTVHWKDGKPDLHTGVMVDISKAKQVEEQFRILEAAIHSSHDEIIITDTETEGAGPKILYVNTGTCRKTGYLPAEIIGQPLSVFHGPLTDATTGRQISEALKQRETYSGEAVLYRKDGTPYFAEYRVSPVLDNQGRVINFIGIRRDITERRFAENALRESEAKYRQFIESTSEGVWSLDSKLNTVFINRRLAEMLGYSVDEFIRRPVQEFFAPEDREMLQKELENRKLGRAGHYDCRLIRKDGTILWASFAANPILDETGTFKASVALVTDVTERRQAEDEIRRSRYFLQNSLDALPSSIAILDEKGVVISVNSEWNRFAAGNGGSLEKCGVGASYLEVCDKAQAGGCDEAADVARAIRGIIAGRHDPFQIEYPCHGDGVKRWFSMSMTVFMDNGVPRIVVEHANVTERTLAEQALKQSLSRIEEGKYEWEASVDALPQAVCLLDTTGRIVRVNRTIEAWDLGRVETIGGIEFRKMLAQLELDELAKPKLESAWAALSEGKSPVIELAELGTKGRRFRVNMHPIIQQVRLDRTEGTQPYAVAVISDITEQVQADERRNQLEEQLLQAQKMNAVGKLAGGIAHDFNNLLVVINGYAQVLRGSLPEGSREREDVTSILDAGERAAGLTRQLLAFSRQQPSAPKITSVNKSIGGLEKLVRRLIRENIKLDFRLTDSPWNVLADEAHLEQVLMNLALNAQDAMADGGSLEIVTENVPVTVDSPHYFRGVDPGDYVLLIVNDTGTGMSEEVQGRAFEPFFTTKDVGKGTGLGLSVVYALIQNMHGHVRIETAPGHGTSIFVYIPAVRSGDVDSFAADVAPAGGTETLLVVEDEEAVRGVAVRSLKASGYRILEAANADEALGVSDSFPGTIDLLLTDVVMPGMDGTKLAEELRRRRPGIRVLFMSGYPGRSVSLIDTIEPDRLINKPYDIQFLSRKVRETLDRR